MNSKIVGQVEFCSDEMCSIDIDRPIKQIVVRYGGVVSGILVSFMAPFTIYID